MINPHNLCQFTGKLPTHEKLAPKFDDSGKNPKLDGFLDVRRNWKAEDAKYYDSDLVRFTAWGPQAKFINEHVKPGDMMTILCTFRRDKVTGDDGEVRYYEKFMVEAVQKIWTDGDSKPKDNDDDEDEADEKPAMFPKKKAGGATKKSNPFAR